MLFAPHTGSDAQEFMEHVEGIVNLAVAGRPSALYVVRINEWFGEKWLGFAGKMLGSFGVSYREELRVPPFVPSRVVDEICYELVDGVYVRVVGRAALHIPRSSSSNLRRKMKDVCPGAAIVWFSGQSARNGRGSVMVYVPFAAGHKGWYAEFVANARWSPQRLVAITRTELDSSLAFPPAQLELEPVAARLRSGGRAAS